MNIIVKDAILAIVLSVIMNSFWYMMGNYETISLTMKNMLLAAVISFGLYILIDLHTYNKKMRCKDV